MPAVQLQFDQTTTLSLESQMARLALEANAISNVIDTFKNIVPSLTSKVAEIYNSLIKEQGDLTPEVFKARAAFKNLRAKLPYAKFTNLEKTLVSVPEGFKGNLLDYVNVLIHLSPSVFQEANKILGEYNFTLSAFITNKETKTSLQDHTRLYKDVAEKRETMTAAFHPFFPKNSHLSKGYLGEVISRFADLDPLIAQTEKLNTAHKNQNIKDITSSVKKSVDMLNLIIADSQSNGISTVSGNAAMNISEGAYEIGKYVEFIAIYRYRVEQAVATVIKLIATLERIV